MKRIGFVGRSELLPESKDEDVCGECRAKGLNLCDRDEVCTLKLAHMLGKEPEEIIAAIDYANRKGLVEVRSIGSKKRRPSQFVRITEVGSMFFGR